MINDESIWAENKNTLPNPKNFKQEEIVKCDITNETKPESKKEILKVTTKIKKVAIKYLYLMVKKHKLTGLKYLCKKITHSDKKAISYTGSGSYWSSHIKKHGKYIDTEILVKMNLEECKKFQQICLEVSEKFNVVENDEWANLIPENGRQGGIVGKHHHTKREEYRECFSKNNPCKNDVVKEKLRLANIGTNNPFYGKRHSIEYKLRLKKERIGINNPKSDKNIYYFKFKNTNHIVSGTRYQIIEMTNKLSEVDNTIPKLNRKDLCRWFLNNGKVKKHTKGWHQI
jgi:hypothetical protein